MADSIMSKAATMEIPINSNGDTGTLPEDDSLEQVRSASPSPVTPPPRLASCPSPSCEMFLTPGGRERCPYDYGLTRGGDKWGSRNLIYTARSKCSAFPMFSAVVDLLITTNVSE